MGIYFGSVHRDLTLTHVLRRIPSTMIDQVVIVAPASSIPARVYLDTVVRHSTLSQATVSLFHQDYPLYLKYADEAEEDFPSIRLRGITSRTRLR